MDYKEYMKVQPIINIGMGGHVSDGKSTTVEKLTHIQTQKFKSEKERNITIKLGYANAKIWKCPNCKGPGAFSSSGSLTDSQLCDTCESETELINHVSFVDCPGHSILTSTMMNGSAVMDYIILVESAANEIMPAPQTAEHLLITKNAGIPNKLILMNKIDVVKREDVVRQIDILKEYITNINGDQVPIIPMSASFNVNLDVLCDYISRLQVPSTRNIEGKMKMIIVRSFDINKPGIKVTQLNGGVIGGTIMQGKLRVGDRIVIFPGTYKRIDASESETAFQYIPLSGEVLSIHSDQTNLDSAISGGLLGIQSTIDPAYTRKDHLSGSFVLKYDEYMANPSMISVYDKIVVNCSTMFISDDEMLKYFAKGNEVQININSNNINCTVFRYSKKLKQLGLISPQPVIVDDVCNVLSLMINGKIIGKGIVIEGIECKIVQ